MFHTGNGDGISSGVNKNYVINGSTCGSFNTQAEISQ